MNLTTTPKIDWDTSDGVADTDMNEIGVNLNSLNTLTIVTLDSGVSWTVPANIVKVKATIIGGGGGGGGQSGAGGTGGTTTFNSIAALGGLGGTSSADTNSGGAGRAGFASGNHGIGASDSASGSGGQIKVQSFTVTPAASIGYTLGAGGTGGTGTRTGGAGGAGQIILEY